MPYMSSFEELFMSNLVIFVLVFIVIFWREHISFYFQVHRSQEAESGGRAIDVKYCSISSKLYYLPRYF